MSDMSPEEKILKKDITVTLPDKSTYRFRIPTARDYVRLRSKVRELVRHDDPDSNGSLDGLDNIAALSYDAFAVFLILYEGGDNNWVLSNEGGKPVVNPDKWPANAPFVDVYAEFTNQVAPFFGEQPGDTSGGTS